jgi:hypothetical protein
MERGLGLEGTRLDIATSERFPTHQFIFWALSRGLLEQQVAF